MIQETFQNQFNYEDLKLIKMLGDGAQGKVELRDYKGEKVAVKTIKNSQNQTYFKAYKKEIQILEALHHRHLIKLLGHNHFEEQKDDGFIQKKYYIVLEYAPNGNLFQYMEQFLFGFDEQICRYYFKQLLEVLLYLQNEKVCHRDIKLENILLDENFDLKLADFGLAENTDERKLLRTIDGTPGYIAPEILNRIPYNGFKADIFSLGVLLFTMFARFYPFSKNLRKNQELLKTIKNNQSERFWNYQCQKNGKNQSFFSNEFKNLMEGMLHPDPDSRFTLDDCLNHVWRNGVTATKEQVFQEMSCRKEMQSSLIQSEKQTAENQINNPNHDRSCGNDEKQFQKVIINNHKLNFNNWKLEKGQIQVLQNQIITHLDVKTIVCRLYQQIHQDEIGKIIKVDDKKCQLIFEAKIKQLDQTIEEDLLYFQQEQEQQDQQEQQEEQEEQDSDEECLIEQNLKIMIEIQQLEEKLIIINVWKLQGDCLMFLDVFQQLKKIIKGK